MLDIHKLIKKNFELIFLYKRAASIKIRHSFKNLTEYTNTQNICNKFLLCQYELINKQNYREQSKSLYFFKYHYTYVVYTKIL